MSDFEVHPIGTTKELKLSRELARAIEAETTQFGQVVPQSVWVAFNALISHYQWEIENGQL